MTVVPRSSLVVPLGCILQIEYGIFLELLVHLLPHRITKCRLRKANELSKDNNNPLMARLMRNWA